jgi:hypothetical protein
MVELSVVHSILRPVSGAAVCALDVATRTARKITRNVFNAMLTPFGVTG